MFFLFCVVSVVLLVAIGSKLNLHDDIFQLRATLASYVCVDLHVGPGKHSNFYLLGENYVKFYCLHKKSCQLASLTGRCYFN